MSFICRLFCPACPPEHDGLDHPHRQQEAPTRRSIVIFGRRTRRANEAFKSTGDFARPRTRGQFRISAELRPSLNFCTALAAREDLSSRLDGRPKHYEAMQL